MKKILLVCPSRGRANRIMEMINSVEKTTTCVDVMVLLDKDDKDLYGYFQVLPSNVILRVYDRTNDETLTTEIINRAFKEFPEYEYYSVTNDDIVYKTKGWDEALCQPLKISCGQDDTMLEKYGEIAAFVQPSQFPITSVIDGDIVRAIGWLQYPKLRHSCGDNIWFWIGKKSNSLYVDINYHTEHNSPYFNKAERDETFDNCNTIDNQEDYYTYKEWLKYNSANEMRKMFKLLREKKLCQSESQEVHV